MIMTGSFLLSASLLEDIFLMSNGIALITVGLVGVLMSWTNMDVAKGIRDAIASEGQKTRDTIVSEGRKTRDAIHEIHGTLNEVRDVLKNDIAKSSEIDEIGKRIGGE